MKIVKLKEDVSFDKLIELGFIEDPVNCNPGDVYHHLNNYYLEVNNFRITVSTLSRYVDILCLSNEVGLSNMYDIKPLYDLFTSGILEVITKS